MATCHRNNNAGSIVLDRHNKLWSAFSFRRKFYNTIGCGISRQLEEEEEEEEEEEDNSDPDPLLLEKTNNNKLSEILNHPQISDEEVEVVVVGVEETKRKLEAFEELQRVVKRLQMEEEIIMEEAALDVRRFAKDDSEARLTLAMLGAIPPLVNMIHSNNITSQVASLYALLNLCIGNDMNKAAIVKAGAVHKMLKLIDDNCTTPSSQVCEAIVANFLALSALDSNKPIIGTSGAIPFLVKTLENSAIITGQAKQDALRAIYNLSIFPSNILVILETDLVPFLLNTLGEMEVSERNLSILSNVVSTPEGRKAISNTADAFPILIDALNWSDSPGCQEKACYILMVMAHKAYGDRQTMIEAGIASSLLELTLLGSTLAQKRASRILECLRVDKGKQVTENYKGVCLGGGAVSAPICGTSSSSTGLNHQNLKQGLDEKEDQEEIMSEERKAVKQLVQQSLQNNMRRIVKRANLPQDFVPSDHFNALTTTTTSKSVPF